MTTWVERIFGDSDFVSVLWTFFDIAVVYFLIYRMLLLIRGTRAVQMLVGVTLIILLYFVSKDEFGDFPTLHWLLEQVINSFFVIIVVVFQKDIRRALVEVGKNPIFAGGYDSKAVQFYDAVVRAATNLAQKQLGAIIAVERETDLSEYANQGVSLDAEVTKELIFSLFIPQYQNPLHDGALIIQKGRATAASCYLPLTDDPRLERSLGSRHRAAVGLSEETDAVVIVVSEETGTISIAVRGRLVRGLDANSLRAELQKLFSMPAAKRGILGHLSGWHRRRQDNARPAVEPNTATRVGGAPLSTSEMEAVVDARPAVEEEER